MIKTLILIFIGISVFLLFLSIYAQGKADYMVEHYIPDAIAWFDVAASTFSYALVFLIIALFLGFIIL